MNLYVFQNAFGLIKIGRSIDPRVRRSQVQSTASAPIKIAAVVMGQGYNEELIHDQLAQFRLTGEWFDGCEASKRAVERELGHGGKIEWPFAYDRYAAAVWLKQIEIRRDRESRIRNHNRLLRFISNCENGSATLDRLIWEETHRNSGRQIYLDQERKYRTGFSDESESARELGSGPNKRIPISVGL